MPHLAPNASRAAAARRAAGGAAQRATRRTAAAAPRSVAAAAAGSRLRRLGDSDLMVHEICLARAQRRAAESAQHFLKVRR
jgi:hypothetical protein